MTRWDKFESKFQTYHKIKTDILAAKAATENHGTYDHSFSWFVCALKYDVKEWS